MKNLFFEEISKYNPSKKFTVPKGGSTAPFDFEWLIANKNTGPKGYSVSSARKKWNAVFLLCLMLTIFLIYIVRAVNLQLINHDKYSILANNNKTRKSHIIAERGVIYDRNGIVLARNNPSFALELNLSFCSTEYICDQILTKVNSYLTEKIEKEKVLAEINSGKASVIIAQGLQRSDILEIEANLYQMPGVSVAVYPIRNYEFGPTFAHVLGYVGLDDKSVQPKVVGKSGIEAFYDETLSGIPGNTIIEVDSSGKNFVTIAREDALPGRNLVTFLDVDLQNKAHELLKIAVEEKKATAGAIVAQDPQTGGVLALVSYPSFDSNKLVEGLSTDEYNSMQEDKSFPFFNRVISAAYPPGSTFKMVTASAGLHEGTITPRTIVFDPGYLQVGSYIFKNWKEGGHGDVNLQRALQVSNDTYFYTVGGGFGDVKGVGIKSLAEWAKKFGYGSLTGIDMWGEVKGHMPDGTGRDWYLGDTYITSIGQGDVLATPLQVNNVTAYFANGGYLMKPRVVQGIQGVKEYETEILSQSLISKSEYETIREGMKMAVEPGGTGYPLFDFPIRHKGIELAGKTGTSEYIDSAGEDKTHAWFTVFGPYDNANIALTVFLEGGGSGSDDAGPIAKELLDVWFAE
ncbi:penicillin-binding protein 2 [candidate division WWE3 bacterium RIFOXYC1_FULL_39_7]|uniref:Penicillin-binding protein 2 n=1 Tax=candidate division WWE3 bacterium RIFOXYC1_FULL_39_7 TaxID=1802643 RepID=A0A1F4WM31_UNCKA|nr:MAG: penicillin-binding protein 2 [candidate division WWE3 bacterium RIFOXYC1_FULL_39_7]